MTAAQIACFVDQKKKWAKEEEKGKGEVNSALALFLL